MAIETLIKKLFINNNIRLSNIATEPESKEYYACNFMLNDKKIFFRKAKITPKKEGAFATFWKRTKQGPIAPYDETDNFDSLIIYVESNKQSGFFVFPKKILLKHNIISHNNTGGKRALRIYPTWTTPTNPQAQKTQAWQLTYFKQK